MKLYMCCWPNGDVSFVLAKTRDEAIYLLDEVDGADYSMLHVMHDFMVHFTGAQMSEYIELARRFIDWVDTHDASQEEATPEEFDALDAGLPLELESFSDETAQEIEDHYDPKEARGLTLEQLQAIFGLPKLTGGVAKIAGMPLKEKTTTK